MTGNVGGANGFLPRQASHNEERCIMGKFNCVGVWACVLEL